MMKFIVLIVFSLSCSTNKIDDELVSLPIALDQAQASYLKGCVDALKKMKVPSAFPGCRDMSLIHRRELEAIMQTIEVKNE